MISRSSISAYYIACLDQGPDICLSSLFSSFGALDLMSYSRVSCKVALTYEGGFSISNKVEIEQRF